MTAAEKRKAVVDAITSREGKNVYTQGSNRTKVSSGYGDCSSTVQWAYLQIGVDIGSYTEEQLLSKASVVVPLTITNGIPDESQMRPGDLLFFRGASSIHASRYKNVGHVEMYTGNGEISGHPSGVGPTRKNMKDYCKKMQAKASSTATPKNCGLICVKRVVQDAAGSAQAPASGILKGTQVQFGGSRHYTSSDGPNYHTCSPCTAEVTAVAPGSKYPYHLRGGSVYGWVAAADVVPLRTGTIVCTSLHLRKDPDSTSASLGIMKHGDKLTITGDAVDGWLPVIWNGKKGFAKNNSSYIRVE